MDLFSDIIAAVQNDLTIGSESTLYDPATVKLAINRAKEKAEGAFQWPQLEDGQKTSSVLNHEYYDYPKTWFPNSIWKLRLDGEDMGPPLLFKDYLFEQANNYPAGKKDIWSSNGEQFFITDNGAPPKTSGDNNIEIWGLKSTPLLVNDSDTTIFSYNMRNCNQALALEAVAILRNKGNEEMQIPLRYIGGVYLLNFEAKQILQDSYTKIKQQDSKRQKTMPYFDVPDFFSGKRTKIVIGDFD